MFVAREGAGLAQLRSIASRVREDIDLVDSSALGEELIEIRRAIDELEHAFARGLHRFDSAREYAAEGAVSSTAWLRSRCQLSGGAAAERVSVARQLPELPRTEAAFARGEVGYQNVAVIARTAGQVGAKAVRQVEPELVEAAAKLDPDRLGRVARHLRHMVDADGSHSKETLRRYSSVEFEASRRPSLHERPPTDRRI